MVAVCERVCVCARARTGQRNRQRQRERHGADREMGQEKGSHRPGTGRQKGTSCLPEGRDIGSLAVSLLSQETGNENMKGQKWAQPRGNKGGA